MVLAALVGLIIGSFLNVVIHRGPALWRLTDIDEDARPSGNLATPRSYCPSCHTQIPVSGLIPIASYFMLGGKCGSCQAPISARYPIVEMLGALAALAAVLAFGLTWAALFAAVFFWTLIALGAIDWETGFLPDMLTLPLIALGLIVNAVGMITHISDAMIGAAAGYGAFRLIAYVFEKLRGIEGLGQGDAKLLCAIGAWLGWQALATTVFAAAMLGLIGVFIAMLAGKAIAKDSPLPFGPALAVAGAAMLIIKTTKLAPGFI